MNYSTKIYMEIMQTKYWKEKNKKHSEQWKGQTNTDTGQHTYFTW